VQYLIQRAPLGLALVGQASQTRDSHQFPAIVAGFFRLEPGKLVADPSLPPLGHAYEQPQQGCGNSWGSWHKLVPTRKVTGWARTYACNWLPETFRIGWHEARLELKEDTALVKEKGLQVMYAEGKGWRLYTGGKEAFFPPLGADARGAFSRGTHALLEDRGGAVILVALGGPLEYRYGRDGSISLWYTPQAAELKKGDALAYSIGFAGAAGGTSAEAMLDFCRRFGIASPGAAGENAASLARQAARQLPVLEIGRDAEAALRRAFPRPRCPVSCLRLLRDDSDNWAVELLDRARPWPNHRALPVRDGRAESQARSGHGGQRSLHRASCHLRSERRQNSRLLGGTGAMVR
jgi:hypothetical protein